MNLNLSELRDEAATRLRAAHEQHRQLAVHIERLIGRISTLNELIEITSAPPEGQGSTDPQPAVRSKDMSQHLLETSDETAQGLGQVRE